MGYEDLLRSSGLFPQNHFSMKNDRFSIPKSTKLYNLSRINLCKDTRVCLGELNFSNISPSPKGFGQNAIITKARYAEKICAQKKGPIFC